jgi:hypothetical protein
VVDLFARFRQVAEGRVRLRVGKIERLRRGRDRADQALAHLQLRQVDGFAVQTFGCIEFEHAVGAQHIDEQTSATMLLAIWRTIRSRRSCGSSGSAINSRSRLSSTRGPPERSLIASQAPETKALSNPADRPLLNLKGGRLLGINSYPDRSRNAKS